jgi:PIN domain nuclease of toxin-antitoxin system
LGEPSATFLPRQIADNSFDLLPIDLSHVTAVEGLPMHHRDPFDRLLIAQATVEQIAIISADSGLDAYGISRLW